MRFLAQKMSGGGEKGKLSMYCRVLEVSRQGYYRYLARQNRPWRYQGLAAAIQEIYEEDLCNDTYGRRRMYQALELKQPKGVEIPSERTVYRVMEQLGLDHPPRRKPNGLTKAEREARKSDDLLKRDFSADKPTEKCVTDITQLKGKDGSLYLAALFDCFDHAVLGLAMADNMRAELCVRALDDAAAAYPNIRGAIVHSDRGSQYTSAAYRQAVERFGIRQSMNSDGGRCHDNAFCESMWARMKCELFYGRIDPESLTVEELKTMVWRYFMSYWNHRRICSANGGLPPLVKRQAYFHALALAA